MLKSIINPDSSGKKTKLVLGIMLIMLLALSTGLFAQNNCLDFDGTDEYVQTTYGDEVKTLEFWLNTDDLSEDHSFFGQRYDKDEVSGNWLMDFKDPGNLRIYGYDPDGTGMRTDATFETGRWYHIAVTSDGTHVTFYVNGVYDSQHTFDAVLSGGSNNEELSIGGAFNNEALEVFTGKLDEVRVWNVVRTAPEIQDNMCQSLVGNEAGLEAYYTFNLAEGETLPDITSNGYNGTLENMEDADWVTSGAALGDASACDYSSPSSVNLASGDGDDVTVGTIAGSPDGVQIYRVDSAPNVTSPPVGLDQLSQEHYFGVFVAGGSSPTYTLTYDYDGHPGITNESVLDLATRANNSSLSWTEANATLDQGANTLTLTEQSGTEYILGSSGGNTLPVVLSIFTAQYVNNQAQLYWRTQTETDNIGWNVYRANSNDYSTSEQINGSLIDGYGTTTEPHDYTFADNTLQPQAGSYYYYWIENIDLSGQTTINGPTELYIPPTDEPGNNNPPAINQDGFYDIKNNPFNPSLGETAKISFKLKQTSRVELDIFNIKGEHVKNLFHDFAAHEKNFIWDGTSTTGKLQQAGVYLYRLRVNGKTYDTQKVILVR